MRALSDAVVVARRNLIKIKRVPDLLVFTTLQPIMFICLFGYVFGSAIGQGDGSAYRTFLMAGIFAQTIIFGSTITGAALAEDMQKGIIDRFRTLPMSSTAVLFGRTLSDLVNNLLVLIVMSLTGLVVGWRITSSPAEALAGFALMLAFAYAFSWVMAYIGMLVRTPEIVNNASFMILFPLTFIANTFAAPENFPAPLKFLAGWNPISTVTQAARELFGNIPQENPPDTYTWALENPVIYTLGWVVVTLVAFVPLATWQYRRAVSR